MFEWGQPHSRAHSTWDTVLLWLYERESPSKRGDGLRSSHSTVTANSVYAGRNNRDAVLHRFSLFDTTAETCRWQWVSAEPFDLLSDTQPSLLFVTAGNHHVLAGRRRVCLRGKAAVRTVRGPSIVTTGTVYTPIALSAVLARCAHSRVACAPRSFSRGSHSLRSLMGRIRSPFAFRGSHSLRSLTVPFGHRSLSAVLTHFVRSEPRTLRTAHAPNRARSEPRTLRTALLSCDRVCTDFQWLL